MCEARVTPPPPLQLKMHIVIAEKINGVYFALLDVLAATGSGLAARPVAKMLMHFVCTVYTVSILTSFKRNLHKVDKKVNYTSEKV